jgi:CRP-like cAMP-binding protein
MLWATRAASARAPTFHRIPLPKLANALLSALPRPEQRAILPLLEEVALKFGSALYTRDGPMRFVYFPSDGAIISMLALVDGRHALEVGVIGGEGMLGVPLVLGMSRSPVNAIVQGAGTAQRIPHREFLKTYEENPGLRRLLRRYTHFLMLQVSQTAACNRFHTVEARLAKWLLMTRDRVGSPSFRLTHEFLSNMLGVRRSGVTQAAQALMRRSLIVYKRGDIMVLDSKGLEAAACSCYPDLKAATQAMLQ